MPPSTVRDLWSFIEPQLYLWFQDDRWMIWVGYLVLFLCVLVAIKLFHFFQTAAPARQWAPRQAGRQQQARSLRREAKRWKRQKAFGRAGECFAAAGDTEHAIEMYRKAGSHRMLAQIFRQQKRWGEAARSYESCGDLQQAAVMYHAERSYAKAAQLYARTGQLNLAAEMSERAGDLPEAADYYEQHGDFERAARLCEQLGDNARAASLYEQRYAVVRERMHDPSERRGDGSYEELNSLARLAAQLYLQAGKSDRAAALLEQAGEYKEAASAYKAAEQYEHAAHLYEQEEMEDQAVECFELAGHTDRARQIRAQQLVQSGDTEAAARLFDEAGERAKAAELFERSGQLMEAAQRFLEVQDFARAAELFLKEGQRQQAAMAWEAGQRLKEAAALYEEIGELDKARGLYEKLGEHYRAALLCQELGHQGRTVELLQKVDSQSDDYFNASMLLGELFISQEMWDAARERYLKLVSSGMSDSGTRLEPLYRLATIAEKQRDHEAALKWYERLLSHDVNYRDALTRANVLKRAVAGAKRQQAGGTTKDTSTVIDYDHQQRPRRYRIAKKIGQGGMGIVYQAEDPVLNRTVAYKVLPPSVKEQPKVLASFLREARISASLNHPNIVAVFDAGHDGGDLYIVMEYIDGISLKERLQQVAPLPLDEFVHVALQVCQGLAYAHRRKIVHRDIKPANIMIDREGHVKIMDFGLAKVVSDALADKTSVKGTPLYMAPEQVTGEHVDHQSDIYSLGCTLYRMATGKPPFTGGDLYYHHLHTTPEPPISLNPQLPQVLNRLLLTCLAKKKTERFSDVSLIIKALQTIPAQPGLTTRP